MSRSYFLHLLGKVAAVVEGLDSESVRNSSVDERKFVFVDRECDPLEKGCESRLIASDGVLNREETLRQLTRLSWKEIVYIYCEKNAEERSLVFGPRELLIVIENKFNYGATGIFYDRAAPSNKRRRSVFRGERFDNLLYVIERLPYDIGLFRLTLRLASDFFRHFDSYLAVASREFATDQARMVAAMHNYGFKCRQAILHLFQQIVTPEHFNAFETSPGALSLVAVHFADLEYTERPEVEPWLDSTLRILGSIEITARHFSDTARQELATKTPPFWVTPSVALPRSFAVPSLAPRGRSKACVMSTFVKILRFWEGLYKANIGTNSCFTMSLQFSLFHVWLETLVRTNAYVMDTGLTEEYGETEAIEEAILLLVKVHNFGHGAVAQILDDVEQNLFQSVIRGKVECVVHVAGDVSPVNKVLRSHWPTEISKQFQLIAYRDSLHYLRGLFHERGIKDFETAPIRRPVPSVSDDTMAAKGIENNSEEEDQEDDDDDDEDEEGEETDRGESLDHSSCVTTEWSRSRSDSESKLNFSSSSIENIFSFSTDLPDGSKHFAHPLSSSQAL